MRSGDRTWSIEQEVQWIGGQSADRVRAYLAALPHRFFGFQPGVPLMARERDRLRAACLARLQAIQDRARP